MGDGAVNRWCILILATRKTHLRMSPRGGGVTFLGPSTRCIDLFGPVASRTVLEPRRGRCIKLASILQPLAKTGRLRAAPAGFAARHGYPHHHSHQHHHHQPAPAPALTPSRTKKTRGAAFALTHTKRSRATREAAPHRQHLRLATYRCDAGAHSGLAA